MNEKELEVLENILHNGSLRQRDLAEIVGLSLGMTNAIVKRLAVKGFLTVRKVNNRNIRYIVSPSGIEEIAKRSYKYFKRTIKNIVFYKNSIDELVRTIRRGGYARIVLVGPSDVDFIVEHLCRKQGLDFVHMTRFGGGTEKGDFLLISENATDEETGTPGRKSLRDVLIRV